MANDLGVRLNSALETAHKLQAVLVNISKAVENLPPNLGEVLAGNIDAANGLYSALEEINEIARRLPTADSLEADAQAAQGLCKALEWVNAEAKGLPDLESEMEAAKKLQSVLSVINDDA